MHAESDLQTIALQGKIAAIRATWNGRERRVYLHLTQTNTTQHCAAPTQGIRNAEFSFLA